MGYTWEEVMLNIDVRDEARKEQKEMEAIQKKQLAEQEAAGMWSLGLSLLGGALFGPVGYMAGKQIGTYGADYAYDWETMKVSPGKFHKEEAEDFNRTIAEAAADQKKGQVLNTVMDLATMYVQAGGLKEGFKGWSDLSTFSTGKDAWTVFSDESIVGKGFDVPFTDWNISGSTLPEEQTLLGGGVGLEKLKETYNVNPIDELTGSLFDKG